MIHEMKNRPAAKYGICEAPRVDAQAVEQAKAKLSAAMTLNQAADSFKVLGHAGRLRVLEALDGQELCVCELADVLGMSMSGISQQLRELRRLGAIGFRVSGKFAYYRIEDPYWLELARSVTERLGPHETQEPVIKKAV